MTGSVLTLVLCGAAVAVLAWVLDAAVRCVLHRAGRFLPSDICGPDGWLVDTKGQTGIFDRSARG